MIWFSLFLVGLFFSFFDLFNLFLTFLVMIFVLFFSFFDFSFCGLFFFDNLSFFLVFLSLLLFIFCFSSSIMEKWAGNGFMSFGLFLGLIFLFLFISFSCFNVFVFYVCFEFIFILMFLFVLCWGYSPERLQASFYMIFYTLVVSFPFLIWLIIGGESLSVCFLYVTEYKSYSWFFLLIVFLVKLPVYGVHLWLPKAHVEAPVSGSMVLAGVLLKLGGYGLIRFSGFVSFYLTNFSGYFYSIGLVGGLISCFLCLRQVDLKAFVAYSSVCHMGLALSGIYSFVEYGTLGSVYMLIGHGFCSSCLFFMLYVFYERYYTRSTLMLKGILYLMPLLGLVWFIFSILNMGVPPFLGFFSEVLLIMSMGYFNLLSLILVGGFLFFAGVYGIYLFVVSSHGASLLDGFYFNFSIRELFVFYGHFYPLVFIPLFLNWFF